MKISSTTFGQQEIDTDTIITFPLGFPGFEKLKKYKLFHQEMRNELQFLQSLEDTDLCFSLMEPALFGYEYNMRLSDKNLELLQTENAQDLIVMLMVFQDIPEADMRRSSDIPINTNWRSPVIINVDAQIGLQKTLSKITKMVTICGE